MKSLVPVTAPTEEPVTLAEAKEALRVDSDDDATRIEELVAIAREYVENFTGRALISQTWKLTLSEWPDCRVITLDRSPFASVESIKYYPASGAEQATLSEATYRAPTGRTPGIIELKASEVWPDVDDRLDAIEINFTAGAASAALVPKTLKKCVYALVAHWYENETPVVIGNIQNELPHHITSMLMSNRVGGWVA